MFQGHNNGLTGICPAQIRWYTVSRQPMTSDLDVSCWSAAVLLAASFRFPTLLPLAAVLLAACSFLTLDIAHGEERGHVQTARAVVLVLFLHMRVLSVLSAGAEPAPARFFVMCLISSSRLPEVFSTRITPAIYLCGLSPDCLRRLLSRSDCPWWGVSVLCCRRQPGTARFFRSWCCSLFRLRFLQNAGTKSMQAALTRSWRTLRLGYHREVVV